MCTQPEGKISLRYFNILQKAEEEGLYIYLYPVNKYTCNYACTETRPTNWNMKREEFILHYNL